MKDGMFTAADVEVHRHPIPFLLWINKPLGILWIDKSQVIPAGPSPLRRRVGFAASVLAARRIDGGHPVPQMCERAFPSSRGLEIAAFRQYERELLFR